MIQFAVHTYLFKEFWKDSDAPLFSKFREMGLEIAEIPLGDDSVFSPRKTGNEARDRGIRLTTGPGGFWPSEADVSSAVPKEFQAGLNWHKKNIDISAELGAFAYSGALYGHPGRINRNRAEYSEELKRAAEALHELAQYASKRNIRLILEPMSHFRTHLVNTPQDLLALIHLIDHENVQSLLDTYHMITEVRDYGKAPVILKDTLAALHASESDRGCPGGGLVPWEEVFRGLNEAGFSGYIMLETYRSSGDFASRRGIFRDVCPEPERFVLDSLAYLKAMMEKTGLSWA